MPKSKYPKRGMRVKTTKAKVKAKKKINKLINSV